MCTWEGAQGSGCSAPHGRGSPESTASEMWRLARQALGTVPLGAGVLHPPWPSEDQTPPPQGAKRLQSPGHTRPAKGLGGAGGPRSQAWAGRQLGLPGPRAAGRWAAQPRGCRPGPAGQSARSTQEGCGQVLQHQDEDAGPRQLVFWVRVPTGLETQEPQRRQSPQALDQGGAPALEAGCLSGLRGP